MFTDTTNDANTEAQSGVNNCFFDKYIMDNRERMCSY